MDIRLTEPEVEVLREILDADISRLLLEIAKTDTRQMREGLRGREGILKSIRERLAAGVRGAA